MMVTKYLLPLAYRGDMYGGREKLRTGEIVKEKERNR
jgi:hypothetical protein